MIFNSGRQAFIYGMQQKQKKPQRKKRDTIYGMQIFINVKMHFVSIVFICSIMTNDVQSDD